MNISSGVDQTFYDDGIEYRFCAELKGERVLVETNMSVKSLKVYAHSPVTCVLLNGKELSVEKQSKNSVLSDFYKK